MPAQRPSSSQHPTAPPELIDPRWILKALLALICLGLVCAYVSICVLFYVQQWQLVLHPSPEVAQNPAAVGMAYEEVHFSPGSNGKAQLDGWWIPGDVPGEPTALLLHGVSGSISDALPSARALHDSRLNVLLFDYRGYGRSLNQHPTETSMEADSDAALGWLASARHVAPEQTIVFGEGLGASLAVRLAERSHVAGIILQQGDGDFTSRAAVDTRSRIVPFRLLFHENFPLADPLHTLTVPKLFLSFTGGPSPVDVRRAADPKMTFEITQTTDTAAVHEAIRRFLDTYLTQPVPELLPKR